VEIYTDGDLGIKIYKKMMGMLYSWGFKYIGGRTVRIGLCSGCVGNHNEAGISLLSGRRGCQMGGVIMSIFTDEVVVYISDIKYLKGVDCFWILDRKPLFDEEKKVITLREKVDRGEEISKILLGLN